MERPIDIMMSNRHAHLTREVCDVLFGKDYELTQKKKLAAGQFAAEETITIKGPKGTFENVRLLGPIRKYTQVELLRADCFVLGVQAPVRESGQVEGAATLTLSGPNGEVELPCGIVALRHIHMGKNMGEQYGIKDKQMVSVQAGGERDIVFNNVLVRMHEPDFAIMHLDMEEGNAAMLNNMESGEILI